MQKYNLKEIRKDLKLTQKKIADTLGITVKSYRCKEKGERPFTQVEIIRFIKLARIPAEDIVDIFFKKENNENLFAQFGLK